MRVLQVIDSLILAGAEVLVRELAPRLRDRGAQVEVAVLKVLDSPLERQLRELGIPCWLVREGSIYSPGQAWALARRIQDFDLIHAHLFPAQLWAPLAAHRARSRAVLVYTEHSTRSRRRTRWFRPADRWIYNQYDAVVCNSVDTAEHLVGWFPTLEARTRVIHNGIPLSRFESAQPVSRAGVLGCEATRLVITVARLEAMKDHATLLRAVAQLPSDVHLALVGDGSLRNSLAELALRLGIATRVHFLGRRPDVPELLKMADVFALSSRQESFGIAALEAMAAGVPVVASRISGLTELIGESGLLFPPGDVAALAGNLGKLLDSLELRRTLSAAGMRRAAEFSIETCADAHLALYQSLIQPTGGSRRA
ncbi:MAG TPA: glycosyltransferase [Terriglobales bacterium]|jgi:glycosyltransferase involved in cell wall biosynthesis|nr:glycosyltransferase [Terriglobales bacterium]